jgi:putative ABC transport system permease protein
VGLGIHLRSERARTSALVAGIAAAAAAFTVLCMNATAPTVDIRGSLPAASPRRAYDILVRVPSRVSRHGAAAGPVRPTDLSELAGGITVAQYDAIRRLPGVQVAAPMTMVGYVPVTVVLPVAVPRTAITGSPELFTVTASMRADDGLSTVSQHDIGSTYVTAGPLPSACLAASPVSFTAGVHPWTTCWSTTTGPEPRAWAGPPAPTVSVPLAWTFLLPLVAVDPAAEAKLLHLNRAVTQGRYLPAGVTRSGPVPVIMASSIDDDAQVDVSLARLPASAVLSAGGDLPGGQARTVLDSAAIQVLRTSTVTAAQAYAALLRYLRGTAEQVPAYWTPSPATYAVGADGTLTPRPVASDDGFRALSLHLARSTASTGVDETAVHAGAALEAVGEFDPARIATSAATPSPYQGEQLSAANAQSSRLLGGRTLGPDGNPAGYPSPGATLVMPLQDIRAFTASGAYTGVRIAAPIGSIRVRVAGATGDDALSRERVRLVAQEIVRATGLPVDVTLAASATMRTIDLAAGRDGRPALSLREVWYRSDTSTTVSTAVDPRSVALAATVLLIGCAFVASGMMAALRRRRRDAATLRALGWGRRHVAWQFGRELALVAASAGTLATLAAYTVEGFIRSSLASAWPLLSMPAAVAMTLVTGWWQVRLATADAVPSVMTPTERPARPLRNSGGLRQTVRSLRRSPCRTALRLVVTVVSCAALGLEVAIRWVFGGVIVGTWLGVTVSWQVDAVDLAAVIVAMALATVTMTDITWRNEGHRSAELRTLRAIGSPARAVARTAASEALFLGLAGGAAASALDITSIVLVVHRLPLGLLLVALAITAVGGAMSLVTVSLPLIYAERTL